ncbi:MAG: hypothetical protein WC389_10030 [Lutibacter sp.]|jgi:hypothetical protein
MLNFERLRQSRAYFKGLKPNIWKILYQDQIPYVKQLIDEGEPILINSDYTMVKKEDIVWIREAIESLRQKQLIKIQENENNI